MGFFNWCSLINIIADEITIESADEGTTVNLVVFVSPPSEKLNNQD